MFDWILLGATILVVSFIALTVILQGVSDRKTRKLASRYLDLVQTQGFKSEIQARLVLAYVQKGDYAAAVRLMEED